jgi:hypothetical protein
MLEIAIQGTSEAAVPMIMKVISGGQTGVDQAALRAAAASGTAIGGWCPPGRVCETGKIPDWFPLKETPSDRSPEAPAIPRSQRTEWNVRDSDATLILSPTALESDGAGTRWTAECATRYQKPLLVCDPSGSDELQRVQNWVNDNDIGVLNVAGPSERTCPGIGLHAEEFIQSVLNSKTRSSLIKQGISEGKSEQKFEAEPIPWWLAIIGRAGRIFGADRLLFASGFVLLAFVIATLLAVKFLNFRVVEGHIYLGETTELGAHATVDAIAAFQTSGVQVKKGHKFKLTPDGRVIVAIDHQVHLAQAVKGFIVQRSPAGRWPAGTRQRYPEIPLTEDNVFYRDWSGPEGQDVQSDLLDDCKLRKDLGWGALMFAILPDEPSARTDPYEVLEAAHLTPGDLIPLPYSMTYVADRDGWLAFIINEAVMSPKSPSEDSRSFYSILKAASEQLANDARHQIPLRSIPLLWYADNAGAFRVVVQQQ